MNCFWQRMKDSNPRSAFGTSCADLNYFVRVLGAKRQIKKQLIETDELLLAADEGFEPSQTESESGVLPLHKSAKRSSYYTVKSEFVNTHSEIFEKKQAIF